MAAPRTPAGVWLGAHTPGTPGWDAARAGLCITATEIPAVLGLSPWQSRFSLWHKKAGLPSPPFEATPQMKWGSRFEDDVEEEFTGAHPEWLVGEAGTWRHKERDWQRATPDRLLYPLTDADDWDGATDIGEPTELLEIKTSPWGDDWEDGLPVYYRAQALWQLDTLGLKRCRVALLILAGLVYREYVVDYDPADAELMRKRAAEFLDDVREGRRPPIDDSDVTYQTVRRQPEGREDVEVPIPAELAGRYENALAHSKKAAAELTGARSEVLDLIGEGRWAVSNERRVAQRTVRTDGSTLALQPCKPKKEHAA